MATDTNVRALRVSEVMLRTGMSRAYIYAAVAAGTFPKSFKIGGRSVAWLESEISAWIAARAATRDSGDQVEAAHQYSDDSALHLPDV